MQELQSAGYWLWGLGIVLLAVVLAGGYILYRRAGGRSDQVNGNGGPARWRSKFARSVTDRSHTTRAGG